MSNPKLEENARLYAELSEISLNLQTPLGRGNDGIVWRTGRHSAGKAFEDHIKYDRERLCYQRLEDHRVRSIHGLTVPQVIGLNDSLMIVEMTLVTPPYLLDFGKAYLDKAPEFPAETMNEWHEQGQEYFGNRWQDVLAIHWTLKTSYGIYYFDARPGNINFGD